MEPLKKKRGGRKPETIIQNDIIKLLRYKEWYVKPTHGNAFQSGFPDLYACHYTYGPRWIEVKVKDKYSFTQAQLENFPKMQSAGARIWVLVEATEYEYDKLFKPANWLSYLSIWKGHRN